MFLYQNQIRTLSKYILMPRFIYTIIFTMISISSFSQHFNYISTVQHFTVEDGLSHQDVNCLVQDDRGVAWVGTRVGLNRFSQRSFKVFTKNEGLKFNEVNKIFCIDNVLWCIHNYATNESIKGFTLFNSVTEEPIDFETYFGESLPFVETTIFNIVHSKETGKVIFYVFAANETYDVYTFSKGKGFKKVKNLPIDVSCFGDPTSTHYEFTPKSIRKINEQKETIFTTKVNFPKSTQNYQYAPLVIKKNGDFWFTFNEKETCFDPLMKIDKNGVLSYLNLDTLLSVVYAKSDIICHRFSLEFKYVPHLDAFCFAGLNSFFIVSTSGELLYQTTFKENQKGLVHILGIDEAHNIFWFTKNNGLYQLALNENHFKTYLTDRATVSTRAILSIEDNLFFTSYDGVFKYSKSNKTYQKIPESVLASIYHNGILWLAPGFDKYAGT